jgi:protease-4
MAKKTHPILTVLIIIGAVALFLCTTLLIVVTMLGSSSDFSFGAKIGVIPVEGAIMESDTIVSQMKKFGDDKGIKAIVLRINSPGGGVGPSQEIYREVQRTVSKKRVIASMGGVAASGGYYIAAAADKIVASPGTITGSIGVIMEFVRFEELLGKIGISLEVLKSGEFKDIGSPHRKLTERDRQVIDALIADIQKQFVTAVAEGRNIQIEKVQEIADGRIFSGAQAKEFGLVDLLGNFEDAVSLAKELAGIEGDVTLVFPKRNAMSLWGALFDSAAKSVLKLTRQCRAQIEYRWITPAGT